MDVIIKAVKTYKLEVIATLILCLVVSYYLYFPPQIGLADSADFSRIFSRLGLERLDRNDHDQFFNFFNSDYKVVKSPRVPVNVGQVAGLFSLWINNIFQSEQKYSIYYLSVTYFLLYLLAYFLLLRNLFSLLGNRMLPKVITAGISIIIFSDILFVSYFNSFYQEALFLVAGVFVVAFAVNKKINYNLLLITLFVLSLSKTQNIIFLVFPGYIILFRLKQLNKIILFCSVALFTFFLIFILKDQKQTNKPNLYESFFLGVLHRADNSEQREIIEYLDFQEVGYLKHVNQLYWRPYNDFRNEDSKIYQEFYSKMDQIKIIQIYLLHPHLFIKNVNSGIRFLKNNFAQPEHLGNYSKMVSVDNKTTIVQTPWGKYLNNLFLPIYFFGFFSLIFRRNNKRLNRLEKVIVIMLCALPITFAANIVAGGINDFVKHNFSVYFMTSLLFIFTLVKLHQFWAGNTYWYSSFSSVKGILERLKSIT